MIKTTIFVKPLLRQSLQVRPISIMAANRASHPPMAEYKQLGKSGLRVSVPILGAMSFGDKRWQPWVIEEAEVKVHFLA